MEYRLQENGIPSFDFFVYTMNDNWFSPTLINWYLQNKRDLPWRRTKNPYFIWISEIILQQTRVAQGLAYYVRFIQRFPSVQELAEAEEDEVLLLWQGLGFYSRARNMHKAAKSIVENGGFPTTFRELKKLKGVGDYTAAAISSIAYNQPHAVVDGNVYRVLSRLFAIDQPIDSSRGKHLFQELADELIDKKNPGVYNQAIMDFGALQCLPQNPNCFNCPFQYKCLAYKNNTVSNYPCKGKTIKKRERFFVFVFLLNQEGRNTYLWKRDESDIWRGLYQPLLMEFSASPSEQDVLQHSVLQQLIESSTSICSVMKKDIIHQLTHQRIHADFYSFKVNKIKEEFLPSGFIKVPFEELSKYAYPVLVNKTLIDYKYFEMQSS